MTRLLKPKLTSGGHSCMLCQGQEKVNQHNGCHKDSPALTAGFAQSTRRNSWFVKHYYLSPVIKLRKQFVDFFQSQILQHTKKEYWWSDDKYSSLGTDHGPFLTIFMGRWCQSLGYKASLGTGLTWGHHEQTRLARSWWVQRATTLPILHHGMSGNSLGEKMQTNFSQKHWLS